MFDKAGSSFLSTFQMNLKARFLRKRSFTHVALEGFNMKMYRRDVAIESGPFAELLVAEMASVSITCVN